MPVALTNAELAELLWRAGDDEAGHRRQALARASRAARFWAEEASHVASAGRSLTELRGVGPWVGAQIHAWLDDPPPVPEADETRRGFLTFAQVRTALDAVPAWETTPHADLQVHTTDSDGSLPLRGMAWAARELGRTSVGITDHSQSLRIANGMDEDRLVLQGHGIDRLNEELAGQGDRFRVLRSIEMDVLSDGSSDMDAAAVGRLDLVLGAFHTRLRAPEDQTERYLAALRNPDVQVLAHPRARMYGRRSGLNADWRRGPVRRWSSTPRRPGRISTWSSRGWPCARACDGSRSAATRTAFWSSSSSPSAWRRPSSPTSHANACSTFDRPASSRDGRGIFATDERFNLAAGCR
jgi:hypothetical protein